MNRLDRDTRTRVVSALLEGCSIRSTVRMTGVSKKAVSRLLVEIGTVAAEYQDRMFRNLTCRRVQVDEIWTFNYCKQGNLTPEIAAKVPNAGDLWLWVAVDADTKVVPCVRLGGRTASDAYEFMQDLASRLKHRVQLTTDGFRHTSTRLMRPSLPRSTTRLCPNGTVPNCHTSAATARLWSSVRSKRSSRATPDRAHISTSYVERQNWTLRGTMRRYTRLSNGFSRKVENHMAAVALNYFAYNFIKVHNTLRVSPAMAAGVTNRLWDVADLVSLLVESESKKAA